MESLIFTLLVIFGGGTSPLDLMSFIRFGLAALVTDAAKGLSCGGGLVSELVKWGIGMWRDWSSRSLRMDIIFLVWEVSSCLSLLGVGSGLVLVLASTEPSPLTLRLVLELESVLLLLLLSRRILMRMHLSAAECSLVLVNWKRKKSES